MLATVKPTCVGISGLRAFVDNHRSARAGAGGFTTAWGYVVGAVGLVLVTAAVVAPLTLYLKRRPKHGAKGYHAAPNGDEQI